MLNNVKYFFTGNILNQKVYKIGSKKKRSLNEA